MDDKELQWWVKEYPELDEEEILDILEMFEDEEYEDEDEPAPTNYTDYLNPPAERETGLKGALQNIIDPDD